MAQERDLKFSCIRHIFLDDFDFFIQLKAFINKKTKQKKAHEAMKTKKRAIIYYGLLFYNSVS